MKNILRFLPALMLLALAGCSAQKRTVAGAASGTLRFEQARQALDMGRFVLEVDKFYFPGEKSPIDANDSFISMRDGLAVIQFSQDLSPCLPFEHLNIEDKAAKLTPGEKKKNGDLEYNLSINGPKYWQSHSIIVTLYHNSDKCFVQINGGHSDQKLVDFTGVVRPFVERP